MRVKDYLQQGYRLEHRIRLVQAEIEELRELSTSVSSPGCPSALFSYCSRSKSAVRLSISAIRP